MSRSKVELYGFLSLKLETSNEREDYFIFNMFSQRAMRVIEIPVVVVGKTPFDGGCDCYLYGSLDYLHYSPNEQNEICIVADAIVPDKPYAITYRQNMEHSFDGYAEASIPTLDTKTPVLDVE